MNGRERVGAIELLGQRERWVDGGGKVHLVQEMDRRYCGNVHAYLLRNGRVIAEQAYHAVAFGPQPRGEMACDAVDAITDELLEAIDNPDRWMKERPLMQALAERMEEFDGQARESREITVVLKLTVPNNRGADAARRSLERGLRGLPYTCEMVAFSEGR